ncbi:hypothetical protein SAMN03159343_3595 [Klenkia marina]|uniref:LTD domain-containing protein n=1 Tax=Klenkia marina TaxID=1960309 RepID=A0A1G4YUS9_9ACTN|nr:ExeM/NucH family extracellular endonuclease [Klenkia marina]SCX57156.1 hypothetical protein SAMN03159343_3595 [Klenkia marina]
MSTSRRAPVLGVAVTALVASGLATAAPAAAVSPDVVVGEAYGGGGNSGATLTNDFVELRNDGPTAVDLSTWSVQYLSASPTATSRWQVTALTGSIAPGGNYLVQQAAGTGGTTPLPTADATGTTAMAAASGTVAVVQGTAPLTCLTAADCAADGRVRDLLGYGNAAVRESAPTGTLSSTTSASRGAGPDTDSNAADFSVGAPTPTGSGGTTPEPEPEPEPEPAGPACTAPAQTIGSVQGNGATSPVAGTRVTVRGTVVGDLQAGGLGGFHVQDAGDGDPATSDGVFVYAPGGRDVALGDVVTVTGTVAEYKAARDELPGTATQLTSPAFTVCGTGALPEPAELPLPSTTEQREALEGMLVTLPADLTVTEVYALNTFGELQVSSGGRLLSPTEAVEPGDAARAVAAENAQRSITVDDAVSANLSTSGAAPPYLTATDPVRVGDTVAALQPSVLGYGFDAYRLQPADGTADGTTFTATNPRTDAPAPVGGDLRIADYNVLNYFVTFGGQSRGAGNAEELARQQAKIVAGITALDADVITLHEIENSAVTTPATPYRAVETLVAAIEAADGQDWEFVRAHEDTDVITNAIVYRTDAVTAVGDPQVPADLTAFDNARSPIAQTFAARGEVFTVVANHFKSKGSGSGAGNTDTGDGQGASNADRVEQATALVAFAQQLEASTGDPDVLLTGDFNSYRYEDPLDVVRAAGYQDMGPVLAPDQYSYVFDGGSGSLDHVFASPSMAQRLTGLTVWQTNAVESYAYQYDGYGPFFAPDPYRASDHNPTVLGVSLAPVDQPATAAVDETRPFRGDRVTVTGTGFAPGERVTVTVAGRPSGSGTADDAGQVVLRPRVPVVLGAGEQPVVLTGGSGETATTTITLRSFFQELVDRFLRLFG